MTVNILGFLLTNIRVKIFISLSDPYSCFLFEVPQNCANHRRGKKTPEGCLFFDKSSEIFSLKYIHFFLTLFTKDVGS